MARRLRTEFPGAIHHVTFRRVERGTLFLDDRDRGRFLDLLRRLVPDFGVRCYLYCLMRNHGHLLVETPRANLSSFMHRLETAYSVYFNLRHHRTGHLLQGRYGAQPVQGDAYLLKLSRYVHLNPVWVPPWRDAPLEARRERLSAYAWSSYREYVGLAEPTGFLDKAPLLALVASGSPAAERCFAQYVDGGLLMEDEEMLGLLHSNHWGIGDDGYRERIAAVALDRQRRAKRLEDVAFRRASARRSVDVVLETVAKGLGLEVAALRRRRYACPARAVAALLLCAHAGLTQRQVAAELSLGTGAGVSSQLRRLEEARRQDGELDRQIHELDASLKVDC